MDAQVWTHYLHGGWYEGRGIAQGGCVDLGDPAGSWGGRLDVFAVEVQANFESGNCQGSRSHAKAAAAEASKEVPALYHWIRSPPDGDALYSTATQQSRPKCGTPLQRNIETVVTNALSALSKIRR